MQSVTIGNNQAGQRLDKFLKKFMPEAGTSFLYKMLRKKNITLNGKKAEGKEMLNLGDTVCFFFSDETFAKFTGGAVAVAAVNGTVLNTKGAEASAVSNAPNNKKPSKIAEYEKAYRHLKGISVLYEDDNVLIVNKPAGILTQKAVPADLSLNEWLIGYLLSNQNISVEELHTFRPSVCNRLDRNTSGIVLCGKSLKGSQILSHMIKERGLRKFYRTICVGQIHEKEVLEGCLVKNEATNKVQIIKASKPEDLNTKMDSTYIKTAFEPLASNAEYTLLEVELITGKPHQIRAHLASTGHPLIGDYKYGNVKVNNHLKQKFGLEAQLLHAYRIEFPIDDTLPGELRGKVITAPYPEIFECLLAIVL